jgi:excisionase family DNA binding protein
VRDYYTTAELARLYGLSRSTVARLVDRGRIPARRVGAHRRIFKADLEAEGLLPGGGSQGRGHRLAPRRRDVLVMAARVRELAGERGATNVRLFGSVARDEADVLSDVDLLVDLEPGRSLIDLAQLELDLEALFGRRVDVGTTASLRERIRDRVMAEAVPL